MASRRLTGRRLLIAAAIFAALALADCAGEDSAFREGMVAYARSDYESALRIWRPLAEAGHAEAQEGLGLMYHRGEGVAQNFDEALRWFRKAADAGVGKAMANLGVMHAKGEGVPEDFIEAYKWSSLALENGYSKAEALRQSLSTLLTAEQIVEAEKRAEAWGTAE